MKTYNDLPVADQHVADAAAAQIYEQLMTDGTELITVDLGFHFVWFRKSLLFELADRSGFRKFLTSMGYLKPDMKHKSQILERLEFHLAFNSRRFKTTDRRIEGLLVRSFFPANGRRRTKKTYDWLLDTLRRNYYILEGNENEH